MIKWLAYWLVILGPQSWCQGKLVALAGAYAFDPAKREKWEADND